ncbi:hypothetical protein BH11BAC3_BH11BAC3_09870 [soil metagenome]
MKQIIFISIIFLLAAFGVRAQKLNAVVNYVAGNDSKNSNNINYTVGNMLNWNDFQAKPVETSDAAAITNAGFGVNLLFRKNEKGTELVINVNCSFSRKDSWVKKIHKTDYILKHEQGHFDIAFISTISFMQKLRNAGFTSGNYAAVIEKIYNQSVTEMSTMQNQYDSQTDHSKIAAKQAEWDNKIGQLVSLAIKDQTVD